MNAANILIVTTKNDPSINLFNEPSAKLILNPTIIDYSISLLSLTKILAHFYNFIYFRDPFNDHNIDPMIAKDITNKILAKSKNSYIIDKISSADDLDFEDKWLQYQKFRNIMPKTKLLQASSIINYKKYLVKKRISSRSRDIILQAQDLPTNINPNDYIVQEKMNILIEMRVFMVGGKIIQPIALKKSKLINQKTKVTGTSNSIDPAIKIICQHIYEHTGYDLMGIDIAQTDSGYQVIEVNRSCQAIAFNRFTDINLMSLLNQYLLSK